MRPDASGRSYGRRSCRHFCYRSDYSPRGELLQAIGKRVRCWLQDAGELTGRLVEVTDDQLGLELQDGERRSVPRDGIRRVRLEPVLPWARQSD